MTASELRAYFVRTAQKYIGTQEGSEAHQGIVDLYNSHRPLARGYQLKYTDAWCAGFVSAISISCGLTDIIPTEVGCGKMIEQYAALDRWVESDGYVPQMGDVIFYDWDDSASGDSLGSADHVGIVESVNSGMISVIEGNYDNGVKRRSIKVDGKYIRGYGIPDFESRGQSDVRYQTVDDVPAYARDTVEKLIEDGTLRGNGIGLDLSEDMVRILVILDRRGVLRD